MIKLELLAPAKSYEYGVEAIKCGADALYIGSEMFGARSAASNSLEDIDRLTRYAHVYGVKIYVAFNTVLYDVEFERAEKLIDKLYRIGVDALIVQDMAICEMNLPPITLHASTQTAALTPQRVKFLQDVGFERVILERAHSLKEIESIRNSTNVELETFVFGSICVSYSGQCYMSETVASRSGNRGVCAQPCRSTYNLLNEKNELLIRNSHLLSVKDLNLENSVLDLITSGVVSFKIEGRLKDIAYLKNSVTYFNSLLNTEIDKLNKSDIIYSRASYGRAVKGFKPQLNKTFSRGFTSYFIDCETKLKVANFQSAKPIGEFLGVIKSINQDKVTLDREVVGVGGDGVCYIEKGEMCGALINRVERNIVTLNKPIEAQIGSDMYRNYDKSFCDTVEKTKSRRVLDVTLKIDLTQTRLTVDAECENGVSIKIDYNESFDAASNIDRATEMLKSGFAKSGETPFSVKEILLTGEIKFIPTKTINEMRRLLFEKLEIASLESYKVSERSTKISHPKITEPIDYKLNVTNKLSRQFFENCGAKEIEDGVDLSHDYANKELMRMKYCLRREINECLKEGGKHNELYIENNRRVFKLNFDCKNCEMFITLK